MQKSYACAGFQSTPPVKAATDAIMSYDTAPGISIHAAREGGDEENPFEEEVAYAFQSTPPVKAATFAADADFLPAPFQSTPPVKAATTGDNVIVPSELFQSTPPVKAATGAQ